MAEKWQTLQDTVENAVRDALLKLKEENEKEGIETDVRVRHYTHSGAVFSVRVGDNASFIDTHRYNGEQSLGAYWSEYAVRDQSVEREEEEKR